ncbi:aminotransferase class III-fold pyridoxal phosphate-dependent enzyme [uncultured Lentibacter sp.]|uniref:aminotransferase class III-fold pyridoxal phosphate-dependent enzyme n=1 Tax=uncultured Lentibacter sp. TaxID=1659309 RepID=UPI00262EAE63|nr:aminotransferase class III-fold pyridoxal phosphate-dependent enzyme [uncultured Lentibacter sp.]
MSAYWQQVLQEHWGIEASLTPLAGEYDLNFLASGGAGSGGADYVLKVMRVGCASELVAMQCEALAHLKARAPLLPVPESLPLPCGAPFLRVADDAGAERIVWVLQKLNGRVYAEVLPKSAPLLANLGYTLGKIDAALADFSHPALARDFKWNLMQADWISEALDVAGSPERQGLLTDILTAYRKIKPQALALPQVAIHNDVNDYNILVSATLATPPRVTGVIDLGDMCLSPRICNLAIACAYVVLGQQAPEEVLATFVAAYHAANPLQPAEIDLIYPLMRMRLAVSVVNSSLMAQESPDDPYVVVSQKPAWAFLERGLEEEGLLRARLRAACGLPVTEAAPRILAWLRSERGNFAPLFGKDLASAPMGSLSVEASASPQNPFDLPLQEAATIGAEYNQAGAVWLGYYNEPRLIYTAPFFRRGPWKASNRRTVHIAVDVFAEAQTPIYAPLAGTVHVVEYRPAHLDYGGVLILRHQTPEGDEFFTLYGHLNPEICTRLSVGEQIEKGALLAHLGDVTQSGGWAPHVHFQLALTTEGMGADWPGVADPDEMYLWGAVCPNPAALLNLPDEKTGYVTRDVAEVAQGRKHHFAPNLKLSYETPLMLLRGWKHHLFDAWGRPYLDAYNNVPHVGHAHPRIQAVAADQLKRINSNTRYLHPAQVAFAEKLCSKMPEGLEVCYFVNSGSEANELALRLARAASGGRDMITPDHGYHGNTTGAIDISAYKFNAKGGVGQPDWVQLVDVADGYRGRFGYETADCGALYAAQVEGALARIAARGGKLAGFIAETYPSVGGQIIPPKGYLRGVYKRIRAAGGICIADEVQTGLGRLGSHYFGFEEQGVTPDIVVLGKPIGNGHPMGVVVTTREISEAFAQGPEYFSTFGGSTLSCRIGLEVLNIVDEEGLMENARVMGARLRAGLDLLQAKHPHIGDLRGFGLFVGVDLVTDRDTKTPAQAVAQYVKERLRAQRILIGTEGPADNILKIRPPLTIDAEDIDMILHGLGTALGEVEALTAQ